MPIELKAHDRKPEVCRELCCNTTGCTSWTYTDPQPGPDPKTPTDKYFCFLKKSGRVVPKFPNGCQGSLGGHCWSGAVDGSPPAPVPPVPPTPPGRAASVSVNGKSPRSLFAQPQAPTTTNTTGTLRATVDVFVDGTIVEVFVNDGERVFTLTADPKQGSTALAVRALAGGAQSHVHSTSTTRKGAPANTAGFDVTIWEMTASIEDED